VNEQRVGALAASDVLDRLVGEQRELVLLLDRSALLRRISQAARAAGGLDIGMVGEPDGDEEIVLRGHAGVQRDGLRGLVVPRGLGLGGKAAALLRPVWVADYISSRTITHDFDAPVAEEQVRAMLSVPMSFDSRFVGVLYVGLRRATRFGDRVIGAVQQVADAGAQQVYVADRLAERTTAAVAAERVRIAGGLHDSVGAVLFTVGAQLREMQADPAASPTLLARLRGMERQIAEAASLFRESLAALDERPPRQRLHAALIEDCRVLGKRTGMLARCVALTELPALDSDRYAMLLRVTREALLNVEKHARASSVVVSLAERDGGVALAVADDGTGYVSDEPGAEVSRSWGLGLRSARERLERLGGSLAVIDNEDGGVTLRAWVPGVTA